MEEKLLFIISPLRSGSTLLQRVLGGHPQIFTRSETHLLTPLAHLGYFHNVEAAPYHHVNASRAIHEFVDGLPDGEEDYVRACRAYADMLYGRMLESSGKSLFLDKTPAYALVADFVTRLYPRSRYIVLTRHPLAVLDSYARTFFGGDYEAAYASLPILDRYVPAIGSFLREIDVPKHHVRYEDLVRQPEAELRRIFQFLGLPHEPAAVEYGEGEKRSEAEALGDPKIDRHTRPTPAHLDKWASSLRSSLEKLAFARAVIAGLEPEDLEIWGYPAAGLFEPLKAPGVSAPPREPITLRRVKRSLLRRTRTLVRRTPMEKVVVGLRDTCDLLLRR